MPAPFNALFSVRPQRTRLTSVWFTLALTVALAACQPAPEPPAYRYTDRDLWKALPQQTLPLEGDTLAMHTVAQPQADGSHVFLFFGDPSAQPNNGDALVMQHLAQANPRSAVWYIDTPDALFM
ncbi:MAG: hypothetical protein KAX68_09650, partial [Giesbergeria sp.]|nr:hypothetical protein [Giesbergeria sp.]